MGDPRDGSFDVQEFAVPFVLQQHVGIDKTCRARPAFGEESRQDVCADGHYEDNRLRLVEAIRERKAGLTEMANAKDGRPNHRDRYNEGAGCPEPRWTAG